MAIAYTYRGGNNMVELFKKENDTSIVILGKTCSGCNYSDGCGDHSGNGVNNGVNGAQNATGTPKGSGK